jgi:spermidine synthase
MTLILCVMFLLSGTAALLFETLWFRQAGIAFGNSVEASALVLTSFMAGLAIGNAAMARFGDRVRRPVRCYALLEASIAFWGVALVWGLPQFGTWLAPFFQAHLDQPWVVRAVRFGTAFALLLVPSIAMGATLPVLVKALLTRDPNFGAVLGRLYGWNTLGAVVGAVAGEWFLIAALGVRGTAIFAGGFNLAAATVALAIARRLEGDLPAAAEPASVPRLRLTSDAWRVIAASFLSGMLLLAFEVVWFRFMHLSVHSGSLVFAWMLAVVLIGIAAGGFMGGLWLRRDADAHRHAPLVALSAGAIAVVLYATFEFALEPHVQLVFDPLDVLRLSFGLTFPVALLSGVLFILLGARLHAAVRSETRAAGLLTLSNTLGAAIGSGIAGLALLPVLGTERSFFMLGAGYAAVAAIVWRGAPFGVVRVIALAGFVLVLALFPFGKMERVYLRTSIGRWDPRHGAEVVAVKEGRIETVVYLRSHIDGETLFHRLLTNGFSMSATSVPGRRYQKLYVWWPIAFHPDPKSALVISYGVGSTAKALTDTRALERIDVVDISREILDLSEIVYPDPIDHPLADPRVRVRIEDGRFHLQTTDRRYDIITGEPPPPKNAGVVNLYTREYFQLIYNRLEEGGITTYWLPVHNTLEPDTKAIIRAFCDVFVDCSLWSGQYLDWMLVGSRNAAWDRSVARLEAQWRDPELAPELTAVGLETPEQLGALFMADADQLSEWVADTDPLTDDWPKRIGNDRHLSEVARRTYRPWLDAEANRRRFRDSDFIRKIWPEVWRERTDELYGVQQIIDDAYGRSVVGLTERLQGLHLLLTRTDFETAPLMRVGITTDLMRAIDALVRKGAPKGRYVESLARRAVAQRDYGLASQLLEQIRRPRDRDVIFFRIYVYAMDGRLDRARDLAERNASWTPDDEEARRFREWMNAEFSLGI